MTAHHIQRPADLDVVRDSYDRVADNYVHMVTTTGCGDIRAHPQLISRAGLEPVAELRLPADGPVGPGVVLVAKRPGEVTTTSP